MHTYAKPTITVRGDVVRTTLGPKPTTGIEANGLQVSSGSNLSFGL